MPEQPQLPAPDRLIRELDTPNFANGFYTELVSRESPRFQELSPIRRGTPYSVCRGGDDRVNALFPALYFCSERVPVGSNTVAGMQQSVWVAWVWSTELAAEPSYSAEVSYLYESTSHPIYALPFTVRRDAYNAAPTAATTTAYTGLVAIKVTTPGTGYDRDDVVNISGSHGATAKLVVDEDGAIVSVIVTASGSGYDSAALPTVTVTSSTGSGVALVAVVLPKTAILVAQKKSELNPSDPRQPEFIRLTQIYQTLPGPLLHGQAYDERFNIVWPFTEQDTLVGSPAVGAAQTEIIIKDSVQQKVRVIDISAIQAVLDTYLMSYPNVVDVQLPDVLDSVSIVWEKSEGVGAGEESGITTGTGNSVTMGLNAHMETQGSGAVMPELIIEYTSGDRMGADVTDYYFFLASPVTKAQVLAKITSLLAKTVTSVAAGVVSATAHGLVANDPFQFSSLVGGSGGIAANTTYYAKVITNANQFTYSATAGGSALTGHAATSGIFSPSILAWPTFRPKGHTIVLKGQKVSVMAKTNFRYSYSTDTSGGVAYSRSSGHGTSSDYGSTIRAVSIRPTIHGAISFGGFSTNTATATADAESGLSGASGGAMSEAITASETAEGEVTPTSLAATSGATSIPTTGLYLWKVDPEIYKYGYVAFRVRILHM